MRYRGMSKIGVFFERHSNSQEALSARRAGQGCGCWEGRIRSTSVSFGKVSNHNSRWHGRHRRLVDSPVGPGAARNNRMQGQVVPASLVSRAMESSCFIGNTRVDNFMLERRQGEVWGCV